MNAQFFSTYSQVTLSFWPTILNLMNKYTRVVVRQSTIAEPSGFPILLNNEQINEVLSDKQNQFIRYLIQAWAKKLEVSQRIFSEIALAKHQQLIIDVACTKLRERSKSVSSQELNNTVRALEVEAKNIIEIQRHLEQELVDLHEN